MLLSCGVGEDSWESLGLQGDPTSPPQRRSALDVHWKDWCWSWNSILWPPDVKSWLIGKDPDAYKDWKQEEKGMTEDEMVGWHHRLNGHEFGWDSAVGDGQGGLACCSSWGFKELHMTEWLNWTELKGKSVNKCIWGFRSQVTAAISWPKESKSGHENMTKGYKHDFLGIAVHNAEFLICFHFPKCVCVLSHSYVSHCLWPHGL